MSNDAVSSNVFEILLIFDIERQNKRERGEILMQLVALSTIHWIFPFC